MRPLKISIPSKCQNEIKYTFHCLLLEFLGIDIEFEIDDSFDGSIIHCSEGNIQIENHFFNIENIDSLYNEVNIPKEVHTTHWSINNSKFPLVSLFGMPKLKKQNGDFRLSSDIISASFFMLTRWEEFAIKERDAHGRFPSKSALSVRYNFVDRAIVNEYVEILWNLIRLSGYEGERKSKTYTIVPTHDVDFPYKWRGLFAKIKTLGGRMKKGDLKGLGRVAKLIMRNVDPYDTYGRLMSLADKSGVKAHFFFMSGGKTNYDNNYRIDSPRIVKLINSIKEKEHSIGLHPSYDSYNDKHLFLKEKQSLEKIAKQIVTIGRQHFLRFEVPTTWNIWNDNEMIWESSMTYADQAGFRCGVCYTFPVFDFLNRRMLNLHEKPLIIMDVTIVEHEKLTSLAQLKKIGKLKDEVKKYNGEFVFLWHNSSFNEGVWLDERILKELYSN